MQLHKHNSKEALNTRNLQTRKNINIDITQSCAMTERGKCTVQFKHSINDAASSSVFITVLLLRYSVQ